ncbi:MAG: hypothetical protein QOE09_1839 [Ilumatobacteraceae bacterium]|jgi:uncharacterized protein (DUF305 family)
MSMDQTLSLDEERQEEGTEIETRPWWQSKLNLGVLAVAIAVLFGALGWVIGNNRAIPDPNATDIGFLQDMRTHHEQGVNLSFYYLSLPGTNGNLRVIAREIVFDQSIDIGRMIELLRQFGAKETNESDVAMTWMHEPTPIDRMPGLASSADIDRLLASSGTAADKLFVDLMIAHHQGGLHMAQYALDHANVIEVRRLAYSMITAQTDEINEMRALIPA